MVDSMLITPTANPARPRLSRPRTGTVLAGVYVALVLAFLYAPIIVSVLFSFATSPRLSLPIEGFTLEWYATALSNPLFTSALRNSLLLALIAFVVASLAGVTYAFGLTRLSGRVRAAFLGFGLAPAVIPLLVIGISLASLFQSLGLQQGILNAAIGHVLVAMPFVILTMNARLETFDFSVLEAARDLGASRWQAFTQITFPIIRPAVIGAGLLAIALSLDEFVVTWFNIGSNQTVPVLIWGMMRRGVDPSVNALATMVLVPLVALATLAYLINRRKK